MSTAIKIENLSKQYRLGLVSTRTLSHDLNRWFQINLLGKDDPYLKIGEVNDRSVKGLSEYVWALKDINLEIEQGEVLGIIGKNGAGKSTLLKILSKVTAPTTGSIKAQGRIASLLEVGTGFHQEMTGRENIFLNGAILGMSKKEIQLKLDEIVDFAGVDRYIDTPVKRYSSGMLVRLAFAVAAHLEPEILVVDEVLAVGDAEFQKKALGKMEDVSKNKGRTVIFVSHNLKAVQNLCRKGLYIDKGIMQKKDEIESVIDEYIKFTTTEHNVSYAAGDNLLKPIQILNATILDGNGMQKIKFAFKEPVYLKLRIKNVTYERDVRYNIVLFDILENIITVDSYYVKTQKDYRNFIVNLPSHLLTPNHYKVVVSIDVPSVRVIEILSENLFFEINNINTTIGIRGDKNYGFLVPDFKWFED